MPIMFYVSIFLPIAIAIILYRLEPLDPASFPDRKSTEHVLIAPARNNRMLHGSEKIGSGQLLSPEDLIYDKQNHVIYTGCSDGWIKQVTLNDSTVKSWVKVKGRALGLAFGHENNVIVADAYEGILNVTEEGVVEVLTREADDGRALKLTDGVDVASNGMIYFTDASYKYGLDGYLWDLLEGRPHGRLLSYDPLRKETRVLVKDLYFANGVAVSPDQTHVVFCETVVKRCRKYYITGEKKGLVDEFTNHLPGLPDNIHYDGDGHYWIGLATGNTFALDLTLKYAWIRKMVAIMLRYVGRQQMEKNAGVFVVDLEGKPSAHYDDIKLAGVTTGIKVGDHLYLGSFVWPHIIRLNITQHPPQAVQ